MDLPRYAALLPLGLLTLSAVQWLRLRDAVARVGATAATTHPFEHRPARARRRVLVLGDSTGVGLGARCPEETVAGLLAADFPDAEIVNASRVGARIADVLAQLDATPWVGQRFDLVLLHIGGNDILRGTRFGVLARQARLLLRRLRPLARRTIWLSTADIGDAPLFIAPFSWFFSLRTRRACRLFGNCARHAGADFIDFCSRGEHPFSDNPKASFAADGVHPSSASYRYCYDFAKRRMRLQNLLVGQH